MTSLNTYQPSRSTHEQEYIQGKHLGKNNSSERKNRSFHNLFKKIPEDDMLIYVFSCALKKDILLQGKLYLSNRHLCFNSNILGWVTSITIPLCEILSIEKKSAAMIFPNSLLISTLHSKYFFASLINRNSSYGKMVMVWKYAIMIKTRTGFSDSSSIGITKGIETDEIYSLKGSESIFCEDELDEKILHEDCLPNEKQLSMVKRDNNDSCRNIISEYHKDNSVIFIDKEYTFNISYLYSLLFDSKYMFMEYFLNKSGYKDVFISNWSKYNSCNTENHAYGTRFITYKASLCKLTFIKSYGICEIQNKVKSTNNICLVGSVIDFPDILSSNKNFTELKYYLTSNNKPDRCRFVLSGHVKIGTNVGILNSLLRKSFENYLKYHFQKLEKVLDEIEDSLKSFQRITLSKNSSNSVRNNSTNIAKNGKKRDTYNISYIVKNVRGILIIIIIAMLVPMYCSLVYGLKICSDNRKSANNMRTYGNFSINNNSLYERTISSANYMEDSVSKRVCQYNREIDLLKSRIIKLRDIIEDLEKQIC